ncbi:Golgi-associated kinase 1B isoform X1 [Oryzias melastigma]|nr:Golgi-associated kinase 1B isoform X1 [Oryzias melastigma]
MGKPRSWRFFPFPKVSSCSRRRGSLSTRGLLVGIGCALFWLFVVSPVGHSQEPQQRVEPDRDWTKHTKGGHSLDRADVHAGSIPTGSNVFYITLKPRRLQPANIRKTGRPKLRRKEKRASTAGPAAALNSRAHGDATQREHTPRASAQGSHDVRYKPRNLINNFNDDRETSHISTIRIYGPRAPPWFSARDLRTMRFLADSKVLRVKEIPRGDSPPLLIFEGDVKPSLRDRTPPNRACEGQCGLLRGSVDNTEVFAFHLDRVLELHRTPPAVSRKFGFLHDERPRPVVLWDALMHPEAVDQVTVRLTWREYQNSLKEKCWEKNVSLKPDSACTTIYPHEWSRLALFDFLLQIHSRLDQSCCGFRPRQEDVCINPSPHAACRNPDNTELGNIVHRNHDPHHLVFSINKGFFDRNEDNLDFRLLEGIRELPQEAMSVLGSRKLREKLLQSLFLDQTFWESQGGRYGIDRLIDVIERRAKVLLTYANAHRIKVIPMNVMSGLLHPRRKKKGLKVKPCNGIVLLVLGAPMFLFIPLFF